MMMLGDNKVETKLSQTMIMCSIYEEPPGAKLYYTIRQPFSQNKGAHNGP